MLRRSYSSRGASSEGKKSEAGNLQNHLSPAWTRLFKIIVALVDWVFHGPLAPAVLDIGTEVSRQVELFQQPRYGLAHVQLSIASPPFKTLGQRPAGMSNYFNSLSVALPNVWCNLALLPRQAQRADQAPHRVVVLVQEVEV